jgi:uncharacterized damage-inducible protein DinB
MADDDPLSARVGERETLTGTLDWFRTVIAHKLDGLSLDDATKVMTASGLSMLGVVAHLAWAERLWFRWRFANEDLDVALSSDDNSETFTLGPDDTIESVLATYADENEKARTIVAAAQSLDEIAPRESRLHGLVSLRWMLVHMIEETARHAGHLDIMREQLDGHTGD